MWTHSITWVENVCADEEKKEQKHFKVSAHFSL
jgi:hypothetical protein